MSEARYHCATSRDVQVIFVEVAAAGSPQPLKWTKPPAYPQQGRAPWRLQRAIPSNSKADATKRLLDTIAQNEAAATQILETRPRALARLADGQRGLMITSYDIG
jgi:hypothetical protein